MKQYNHYLGTDLTFVVCAYKECEYLEECIKSLLEQTEKANIVISTSTPNNYIMGIAEKFKLEVRVNQHGGQVKDYNFALKQADTELVMLMHQDEILDKHFVERVIKELNLSRRPIIAFTNYLEMHEDIVDKKPSTLIRVKRIMLLPFSIRWVRGTKWGKWLTQCLGNPITHPTVVCVKKEMPEICFREEYKATMDWDLWQRLSRQEGSFVYVKDVLLFHRMNDANQTVQLLRAGNVRSEEEYEIMCRFWPAPIAKLIMKLYSKALNYY